VVDVPPVVRVPGFETPALEHLYSLPEFLLAIRNNFSHFEEQAKQMVAKFQTESNNEPHYRAEEKRKTKSKK
jgi:hypothetical protein